MLVHIAVVHRLEQMRFGAIGSSLSGCLQLKALWTARFLRLTYLEASRCTPHTWPGGMILCCEAYCHYLWSELYGTAQGSTTQEYGSKRFVADMATRRSGALEQNS